MALIVDQKEFVKSVSLIVETDMSVVDEVFPTGSESFHKGEEIEFDSATIENEAPEYSTFKRTADVVEKDGKDVVTLKPLNYNESISKTAIDAYATKFGQNAYGEGSIDATTQSALTGVGKLHRRTLVGIKKTAYEILTTFKVVGGHIGSNGAEDIVFNVPAANKEVFDGTTLKYWSNAASTPVTDIVRMINAMKIKPEFVLMNNNTYTNFFANAQILTADNSTTGTKRNYIINENVESKEEYYVAGKLMANGVTIDIKVDRSTRKTGGSTVPFMPNGYVSYASSRGEMNYASIPVAVANGVELLTADFHIAEVIQSNPVIHELIYKSAPLPTIKNGEAFASQKVEA